MVTLRASVSSCVEAGGRGGRGCGAVGWSLKGGDMGLLLTPMLLEAGIDLSASCGCFEDK